MRRAVGLEPFDGGPSFSFDLMSARCNRCRRPSAKSSGMPRVWFVGAGFSSTRSAVRFERKAPKFFMRSRTLDCQRKIELSITKDYNSFFRRAIATILVLFHQERFATPTDISSSFFGRPVQVAADSSLPKGKFLFDRTRNEY